MTLSSLKDFEGVRLDIGCGENKQPGFLGIDLRQVSGVDIVHDLEDIPWPLPDECALMAVSSHLVEHISPVKFGFVRFMDEAWRVLKVGAQFAISCPHGYSPGYLQDPTHCNPINETTWAYFDPLEPRTGGLLWQIYKPRPWRIEHLSWSPAANIEVLLVKRSMDELNGHRND